MEGDGRTRLRARARGCGRSSRSPEARPAPSVATTFAFSSTHLATTGSRSLGPALQQLAVAPPARLDRPPSIATAYFTTSPNAAPYSLSGRRAQRGQLGHHGDRLGDRAHRVLRAGMLTPVLPPTLESTMAAAWSGPGRRAPRGARGGREAGQVAHHPSAQGQHHAPERSSPTSSRKPSARSSACQGLRTLAGLDRQRSAFTRPRSGRSPPHRPRRFADCRICDDRGAGGAHLPDQPLGSSCRAPWPMRQGVGAAGQRHLYARHRASAPPPPPAPEACRRRPCGRPARSAAGAPRKRAAPPPPGCGRPAGADLPATEGRWSGRRAGPPGTH